MNNLIQIFLVVFSFCMRNLELIALQLCLLFLLKISVYDFRYWFILAVVAFCSGISNGYIKNEK
jgi:hypothetical protein